MTRYLLDTHIWLWFSVSPSRLPEAVTTALLDPANEAWISVVNIWELAIKASLGKLALPKEVADFTRRYGDSAGFPILPVEANHAASVEDLPQLHSDPFDRLLVCQAQKEEMVLVTADTQVSRYPTPILWAGR